MNLLGTAFAGVALLFLRLEIGKVTANPVLAHTSGTSSDHTQDFISATWGVDALVPLHTVDVIYH